MQHLKPWIYLTSPVDDTGQRQHCYDQGDISEALSQGLEVEKITFTDEGFEELSDAVRRAMAGRRYSRDTSDRELAARIISSLRGWLLEGHKPPLEVSSVSSVNQVFHQPQAIAQDPEIPELKPCPLCNDPIMHDEYPPMHDEYPRSVGGFECGGPARYFCVHAPCCDYDGPLFATRLEAALHWNRRKRS